MNAAVNWKDEIGLIAGSYLPSDTRESWLARAARSAKVPFGSIVALYYGKIKDPRYSLAHRVLSAAEQARIDEARRNAQNLANTYQSAAHALANTDENFYRHHIDALVSAARILGSMDRPGTEGAGQ